MNTPPPPLAARLLAADLWSSGLSAAVLAWRGRRDAGSAAAPLNAVAHWVWPRRALREDAASARFTLTGLAVHGAAALLWCGLFDRLQARRRAPTPLQTLGDAAAVTAMAAVVDLRGVPERLTPGFERRLSRGSLALVYGAFGLGLALSVWVGRPRSSA